MNSYFTIIDETESETIIEHSKFICKLKAINSEEEAKEFIKERKKEHSLATHNSYAFIADNLGQVKKFSDDGEPQGTAGAPMLDVLIKENIFMVSCVVTRYFGGIKLGTGGLTHAYSGAVKSCLAKAKIVKMTYSNIYQIDLSYDNYSNFLRLKEELGFLILDIDFNQNIKIEIAVKEERKDQFNKKIMDYFNGIVVPKFMDNRYCAYEEKCWRLLD